MRSRLTKSIKMLGALAALGFALSGCEGAKLPTAAEKATLLGAPCREIPMREARRFTLEDCGPVRRLTVSQPWRGSKDVSRYLLVPRSRPDLLERARRLSRIPDVTVVAVPVRRIVSLSTVYAAFLDQLGMAGSIVGMGNSASVWTPSVQERIRRKEIGDLGKRGMQVSQRIESMLLLAPDLVLASGSGIPAYDRNDQFREFGLPVVVVAEWMEDTPLGRAEWIRFLGAFVDRDSMAQALYQGIVHRYDSVRQARLQPGERPKVVVGSNWSGSWNVPSGGSYAATFLRDAGADYPWKALPGAGSVPLGVERVVLQAHDADVWVHPGQAKDLKGLAAMDPRNGIFQALGRGQVFNNDKRTNKAGGNDYWESGVVNPDRVLADLATLFHPSATGDTFMTYYRRLRAKP